jgi:hypothetical protein
MIRVLERHPMGDQSVLAGDKVRIVSRGKVLAEKIVERKGFWVEALLIELIDEPAVGKPYALGGVFVIEDYVN